MNFAEWGAGELRSGRTPTNPVEAYRGWCRDNGVLPRTATNAIDNCALVAGESASDCQVCSGKCPDAVRLFQVATGSTSARALELLTDNDDAPLTSHGFAHTSVSDSHFTPYALIGAITRALGGAIDLDPASCALANNYIEAGVYFDREANGLQRRWFGRVFLNPPGGLCDEEGRPCYPRTRKREGCTTSGSCGLPPGHSHKGVTSSAKHWWTKLARERKEGNIGPAVFLGFSVEQLSSIQDIGDGLLVPVDCPLAIPRSRVRYLHEDEGGSVVSGDQPPHASYLAYLGEDLGAFERELAPFGKVLIGHHDPLPFAKAP